MSNQHELVAVLKASGYDSETIRKVSAAVQAAQIAKAQAARAEMTEMTPLRVAAKSAANERQLRVIEGEIFHASGCKYRLPQGRQVDIHEVDAAIRNASIETRARIKSGLRSLGLIQA